MIVGGYTLDLYCDSEKEHPYQKDSVSVAGINGADARKKARKWGWVINDRDGTCYCPLHAKIKDR